MSFTHALCHRSFTARFLLVSLFFAGLIASADARSWVVNQRHAQASDDNTGVESSPFLTINKAAQSANAGDTVLVYAGTYRERVSPARSGTANAYITYMAAPGDTVYIKGSEVWTPAWQNIAVDVYAAKPDPALFGSYNPYRMRLAGGTGQTLGQIFVNGRLMQEMTSRAACMATASSWWRDSLTDTIFVRFPAGVAPTQALVELTVRPRVFAPRIRGLAYIRVKGFIMEHCANQNPAAFDAVRANAQAGLIGPRSGNHWIIENNVIRHAKSIGIDFGNEGGLDNEGTQPTPQGVGYHLIQANIISDNGICGICGMSGRSTRILNNIIERNDVNDIDIVENAGFKSHNFNSGVVEGNIVRYNKSYGIWLDSGWPNARVTRNLVYGNQDCGIFFELGPGPAVCDNNIVVYNRQSGMFVRDAANVTVAHNLFYRNSAFGIYLQKYTGRNWGSNPAYVYGWKIFNNIIYRNLGMEIKAEPDSSVYNNTYGFNVFLPGKLYRIDTTLVAADTLIDSIRADTSFAMGIRIAARSAFFSMACTTFSGIARDYAGNPMPANNPLAGPFQGLRSGINDLSLIIEGVPQMPTPIRAGLPEYVRPPKAIALRSRRFAVMGGSACRALGSHAATIYTIHGRAIGQILADAHGRTRMPATAGILIAQPDR